VNEATRANLQANKIALKWQQFWNKVYKLTFSIDITITGISCEINEKEEIRRNLISNISIKAPFTFFINHKYQEL